MKKIMKVLPMLLGVILLVPGCNQDKTPEDEYEKDYTLDEYTFIDVFKSSEELFLRKYNRETPFNVETKIININQNIGDKNYIRINYVSNVNVIAYISYYNASNKEENNTETIFLKKDSNSFTMFLDGIRRGAKGNYNKVITSIEIKNSDHENTGNFTLKSLGISDRTYDQSKTLYIKDGTMKFGAALSFGGCISYIERLGVDVVEYLDDNNNIVIDRDIDTQDVNVITDHVNLVNTYDLGREIQQSYYWPVSSKNGYDYDPSQVVVPGEVNYNPIQCGSPAYKDPNTGKLTYNYPQIIDYVYKKDKIYVKAFGQDWYMRNQVDPIYFESTYTFGEDGVLKVNNKITSFSEFYDYDDLTLVGQEAPAFYAVHPLHNFYTETKGDGVIFDGALGPIVNHDVDLKQKKNDPGVPGKYHYRLQSRYIPKKWCAFVNDDLFGLGIYSPNASFFTASRGATSTKTTEGKNLETNPLMWDDTSGRTPPSQYTFNYGYINPAIDCRMVDFIPLEFNYAVFAGDTDEMNQAFGKLEESQELKTEIAWPQR